MSFDGLPVRTLVVNAAGREADIADCAGLPRSRWFELMSGVLALTIGGTAVFDRNFRSLATRTCSP